MNKKKIIEVHAKSSREKKNAFPTLIRELSVHQFTSLSTTSEREGEAIIVCVSVHTYTVQCTHCKLKAHTIVHFVSVNLTACPNNTLPVSLEDISQPLPQTIKVPKLGLTLGIFKMNTSKN